MALPKRWQDALHYIFEVAVTFKFVDGIIDMVVGTALVLISPQTVSRAVAALLAPELLEDSKDLVANAILNAVQGLSANEQAFIATYLLVHGAVKAGVSLAFWTKRLWAYPIAGAALALLLVYQVHHFAQTHSLLQLALILADIVILVTLRNEHRRLKRKAKRSA